MVETLVGNQSNQWFLAMHFNKYYYHNNYLNGWLGKITIIIIINRLSNTGKRFSWLLLLFPLGCCRRFGFASDFELHLFFFLSAMPIQCDAVLIQIVLRKWPFVHWPLCVWVNTMWWISMFLFHKINVFDYINLSIWVSNQKENCPVRHLIDISKEAIIDTRTNHWKHKNWFFDYFYFIFYFIFLLRHINIISAAWILNIDFNMKLKTNNLYGVHAISGRHFSLRTFLVFDCC